MMEIAYQKNLLLRDQRSNLVSREQNRLLNLLKIFLVMILASALDSNAQSLPGVNPDIVTSCQQARDKSNSENVTSRGKCVAKAFNYMRQCCQGWCWLSPSLERACNEDYTKNKNSCEENYRLNRDFIASEYQKCAGSVGPDCSLKQILVLYDNLDTGPVLFDIANGAQFQFAAEWIATCKANVILRPIPANVKDGKSFMMFMESLKKSYPCPFAEVWIIDHSRNRDHPGWDIPVLSQEVGEFVVSEHEDEFVRGIGLITDNKSKLVLTGCWLASHDTYCQLLANRLGLTIFANKKITYYARFLDGRISPKSKNSACVFDINQLKQVFNPPTVSPQSP